jgi:precorrin-2 dehydrogenase/sirohydrochlorin ferrochelatase
MKYYPVYLNLKGRRVLLVGAGDIGLQKLGPLLRSHAQVHAVAPQALPAISRLARDGKIKWSKRSYRTGDMSGAALVIAATSDPVLQKKVARDARSQGIWVNVVDVPPLCDFIAPAIVSRGDLQIAVSTGGAAPALAKYLRKKLESAISPEHAQFVAMVKKWRPAILKLPKDKRKRLWSRLVNDSFLNAIRQDGIANAERKLKEWMNA